MTAKSKSNLSSRFTINLCIGSRLTLVDFKIKIMIDAVTELKTQTGSNPSVLDFHRGSLLQMSLISNFSANSNSG